MWSSHQIYCTRVICCDISSFQQQFGFNLGGGLSYMLVEIKCMSSNRSPFFTPADLIPNDPPFFLQSTPNDPFFPLSYQKIANFHALCVHFQKFTNFAVISNKICQFWLEIAFLHTKGPPFLEVHIKKDPSFLELSPHDPFFQRNLTLNAPTWQPGP